MASDKPIISTVKMGYCILDKYKCGLSLEKPTPEELAEIIIKVQDMPKDQYKAMGMNARKGALDFDFKIQTGKLIKVLSVLWK